MNLHKGGGAGLRRSGNGHGFGAEIGFVIHARGRQPRAKHFKEERL